MSKTKSLRRSYRKKSKQSTCKNIKRSAVCKRRSGCTYARGNKRRYCRTSKNIHSGHYKASRKNRATRKNKSK